MEFLGYLEVKLEQVHWSKSLTLKSLEGEVRWSEKGEREREREREREIERGEVMVILSLLLLFILDVIKIKESREK